MDDFWDCEACTYTNEGGGTVCMICDTPRSAPKMAEVAAGDPFAPTAIVCNEVRTRHNQDGQLVYKKTAEAVAGCVRHFSHKEARSFMAHYSGIITSIMSKDDPRNADYEKDVIAILQDCIRYWEAVIRANTSATFGASAASADAGGASAGSSSGSGSGGGSAASGADVDWCLDGVADAIAAVLDPQAKFFKPPKAIYETQYSASRERTAAYHSMVEVALFTLMPTLADLLEKAVPTAASASAPSTGTAAPSSVPSSSAGAGSSSTASGGGAAGGAAGGAGADSLVSPPSIQRSAAASAAAAAGTASTPAGTGSAQADAEYTTLDPSCRFPADSPFHKQPLAAIEIASLTACALTALRCLINTVVDAHKAGSTNLWKKPLADATGMMARTLR